MSMDIFDFLLIFSIGWFGGQWYLARQIRKQITQIAEKYGMTFEEWADSLQEIAKVNVVKIPVLVTEYVGNSIYLYHEKSGKFLCQGNTLEELADTISKDYNMAVVKDNDKTLFFSDGKVKLGLDESETKQI